MISTNNDHLYHRFESSASFPWKLIRFTRLQYRGPTSVPQCWAKLGGGQGGSAVGGCQGTICTYKVEENGALARNRGDPDQSLVRCSGEIADVGARY